MADIIVIGAGVIGAATAFELAKQDHKVLSVDANGDAGMGSTAGSCAVIRVHYSTLDGTALAWEGYHYWRDWADYLETKDEAGLAQFKQCGCLVMAVEANGYLEKHKGFCRTLKIPYEDWGQDRILDRFPQFTLKAFAPAKRMDQPGFGEPTGGVVNAAVYWPTAGYITDPQLSSHNLRRAAEAKGASFRFNAKVVEILKARGRVAGVKLADGTELHAPVVVNVGGPHSAVINRLAGVTSDMTIGTRAVKQEVVHLPAPEGMNFEALGFVMSDSDISVYSRPEKGNHILIGSEDPECDPREVVNPDAYDMNFTDQWTHQACRYAQRLPSLGIPSRMKGVVELYDVSDDWLPIYDRSSLPGFYMACGSSGNQFKNAPIAGKMMAALIDYCEAGNDHDARPMQFMMPYTQQEMNVGFYSRRREINPESSFSVLG
ncbi:MAG: FAD-dependent oxidoreductase [Rhodospirillaceae bacterium]|nr:FAD-dependent oxidoreductase [Rhodospirillaceae bacterium]